MLAASAGGSTSAGHRADAAIVLDEKGIIMYNYGRSVGTVYNPTVLALEGAKYYYNYESTGDPKAKQNFINTAEWLVENAVDKGNYSLWEYNFDWGHYDGFTAPYSSALAQARGIDVLIKAHNMTGDERYLHEAKKAFGAYLVDYEHGGVASNEGTDSIFLQILAKPGAQKTYVLNSHTKSLLLLWEYHEYTNDYRAMLVFGKGMNWLVTNLPRYDTGSGSYYDLLGTKANSHYHYGQTKQIRQLYEITGEPVLKEYSDRFAAYAD